MFFSNHGVPQTVLGGTTIEGTGEIAALRASESLKFSTILSKVGLFAVFRTKDGDLPWEKGNFNRLYRLLWRLPALLHLICSIKPSIKKELEPFFVCYVQYMVFNKEGIAYENKTVFSRNWASWPLCDQYDGPVCERRASKTNMKRRIGILL